jgi:hypothetical protein
LTAQQAVALLGVGLPPLLTHSVLPRNWAPPTFLSLNRFAKHLR